MTPSSRIATLLLVSGVLGTGVLGAGACSSENGDGTGTDEPVGCDTNYDRLSDHATVSLMNDVMPIFGQSCTGMSCHDEDGPKAGLLLGPKCNYNSTTRGCDFDPPLTAEQVTAVYDNLVNTASATSASVIRITPGDPTNSFLLMKTADVHNDQGLSCEKLGLASDPECGQSMPPGTPLCKPDDSTKHDIIAAWVLQGAENN